jgi:hypothetical protein
LFNGDVIMTFQDIWNQLCRKQPSLEKPETTVEFKSDNLKALLRQVYEQGQKSIPTNSDGTRKDPMDIFGGMFGGR